MRNLIIIPTYNEALNIEKLIFEIKKVLSDFNFSILIVDDSSADGTGEIVKSFDDEKIMLLERKEKSGLASAYIDGFKFGLERGFDAFIQMDADFSHNPKYLPVFFEKLQYNDVVIASRNVKGGKVEGWSVFRNFISKGGSFYSRTILKCDIKDLTGGFNGWRAEILNKIGLDKIISKGYSFQIEMKYKAYKNNAKIEEFPITFADRKFGKSKMNKSIFFEALFNVLKIKTTF